MRTIDTLRVTGEGIAPRSTCVALGLFDGVHLGHQAVIDAAVRTAREHELIPAVFTFTTRRSLPGQKREFGRLMSDDMLADVLAARGVELLFRPDFEEFKDLTPEAFVGEMLAGAMGAGCLTCGYDYRFGQGAAGDVRRLSALADARKIPLEALRAVELDGEAVSSTRIRELVRDGDMARAAALMDRRFAIDFEVIHGNQIGKTLGWPTINQPFPDDFTLPRFGVYATLTTVNGKRHSAVTNVGVKPTVGSDAVLAETYIQGFSGDLYRQRVCVEFLRFVRPEQKFDSLDALRARITEDAAAAGRIAREYL